MSNPPESLQTLLTHQFTSKELLSNALTHRSAAKSNNERLEFLGDSVLGFLVAEYLFEHYPESPEGELSRMRSSLVNKKSLAWIARELNLGEFLQMGSGERSSGGAERDSNLSNAVEALIAAIYLDGGIDACRTQVTDWTVKLLKNLETISDKDAKTLLQERMQSDGIELPRYEVVSIDGEAHAQTFTMSCSVASAHGIQVGEGSSKRSAEQAAAKKMLEHLETIDE